MASATAFMKSGLSSFGQSRLVTIFKIKELRQKIMITILFLAIYRIGFHVPLPMINQVEMAKSMRGSDEGLLGPANRIAEIADSHVQCDLAPGDARQLEQILDQPNLQERIALDHLCRSGDVARAALPEHARPAKNRGERRAQLV